MEQMSFFDLLGMEYPEVVVNLFSKTRYATTGMTEIARHVIPAGVCLISLDNHTVVLENANIGPDKIQQGHEFFHYLDPKTGAVYTSCAIS